MKGLSNGIVHMIILIAAVVITIAVVGFVFGLFGAIYPLSTAYQVYSATLYSKGNYYVLNMSIRTNLPATIVSVQVVGQGLSNSTSIPLKVGTNTVVVWFKKGNVDLITGTVYIIDVGLSNGNSLTVSAEYIG